MCRLAAFVACASILACTKSEPAKPPAAPAGPRELREVEPNDSVDKAMPIAGPALIQAELAADPQRIDEDCYRIEALGGGKVASIQASGIPGVDLALELLDRDGNHVASFNSEPEGAGEQLAAVNLGAPAVVKVAGAKKGSGGAYTLRVSVADAQPDFEVEPNNRAVDATSLPLGKPMRGLLADRADEDWYRFEVPIPPGGDKAPASAGAGEAAPAEAADATAPPAAVPQASQADARPPLAPAVVRLEVTGVPGVRLQVEIANQAQAVFYTARSREEGEGIQVRNLALRPGETSYFATVKAAWVGTGKDAHRGYNTQAPYALSVALEEAGANAELEPNDEPQKATPLAGDGMRVGYFAPKGDVDYYLVRVDRPVLLKVELSGVDRVDSTLSLVRIPEGGSEKEEVLLAANDGGVREGEILVDVAAGPGRDALLRVEAAPRLVNGKWARDQENPSEPYKLVITSRPDLGSDEREPNNKPELATPIELGRPVRGHVHPRRDEDFYLLDLSRSPVKVPLKATLTGILKVDVSLGLFRLEQDGKPTLVQRSEKGKGEQPEIVRYSAEPGQYVFQVKDTKSWQSNYVDAYQLTVEQDSP
jgi:hypothetical protein